MRSRRRRRSRSTNPCPRSPGAGSWRSMARRPSWCGRSRGRR
ncbi:putative p32 subunit of splicing factor SF2 [Taeniopygia guttata]|uniref:Putative p32 subunit of splicing factor SF2 n=1 Tax=Taeniopygia guttata TaxID=59729 RepID=B5FXH0_TAEGU|nr:putative p32 subunit of splicing factor SF2 [Taeniopygia guttata]ACH43731.1 putative p32 subunit of splicing factor SF2 [Taeniopygia guttata]